jgi:hypothetical protein
VLVVVLVLDRLRPAALLRTGIDQDRSALQFAELATMVDFS